MEPRFTATSQYRSPRYTDIFKSPVLLLLGIIMIQKMATPKLRPFFLVPRVVVIPISTVYITAVNTFPKRSIHFDGLWSMYNETFFLIESTTYLNLVRFLTLFIWSQKQEINI